MPSAITDTLPGRELRYLYMKSSTHDKIEGKVREAVGAVKEKVGEMRRDPVQMDEGNTEKNLGKAQSKLGDIKKVFDK